MTKRKDPKQKAVSTRRPKDTRQVQKRAPRKKTAKKQDPKDKAPDLDELTDEQVLEIQIEHPKKRAMLEALGRNGGIVTTASVAANVGRLSHYRWLKEDPVYAARVKLAEEKAIDNTESKLIQLINGVTVQRDGERGPIVYTEPPNVTAIIFHLKTKGKHRGYVERQEVDKSKWGKTRVVKPKAPDEQ